MLYRLYRACKRLPFVGTVMNAILRRGRNQFWSWRGISATNEKPPADYLAFVESGLADGPFTLIEIGSGDGRMLRELASRHPKAYFIGIDIHKAAVEIGNRILAKRGITNVELLCTSCLGDAFDWNCDYVISRTALIYLNRSEIETFFRKWLPHVRRALLLQEITSVTGKTGLSHFFANPLVKVAESFCANDFSISERLLDYPPWKREEQWCGADIVIRRISSGPIDKSPKTATFAG